MILGFIIIYGHSNEWNHPYTSKTVSSSYSIQINERKEKEQEQKKKNNIKIDHIRFLFVILLDDPMVNREWKMQQIFFFFRIIISWFIFYLTEEKNVLSGVLDLNIWFFFLIFCSAIPCVWFTNEMKCARKPIFFFIFRFIVFTDCFGMIVRPMQCV